MNYDDFLNSKQHKIINSGFELQEKIHPILFDFQRDIVKWALRKGQAAIFLDTGLGKSFIQLEFARLTNKKSIIVAPLSVARQTIREAKKIDIDIKYVRNQEEINSHLLYITNYELIDRFNFNLFETLILDESSILKSIDSKIKKKLFKISRDVPFRLACTATPAPNDIQPL